MSDWIETGNGVRVSDDLTPVMVRNRTGLEFGPVLAGMINTEALDGNAFHYECDIIAYREVPA